MRYLINASKNEANSEGCCFSGSSLCGADARLVICTCRGMTFNGINDINLELPKLLNQRRVMEACYCFNTYDVDF